MYSLVSAPVLGFDLVRLPGGPQVAHVLLRALALTEADLPVLAAAHDDGPARESAWFDIARTEPDQAALRSVVRQAREIAAQGRDEAALTVSVLRGASIGTLDWLMGCIADDVFDWTWTGRRKAGAVRLQSAEATRATAVVCDAAAASYLGDRLGPEARLALQAGWLRAQSGLEGLARQHAGSDPIADLDLGPQSVPARALLDRVARIGPADLERLTALCETWRMTGSDWARAVHEASWAVHLTGRVRPAAAAQLLLVQAVREADVPLDDLAGGTWNVLSGGVHALVARDVLPDVVAHRLLAPITGALGAFG